jgi:hypothetical protein
VRFQILPEIQGNLKTKAKKFIYEYCATVENRFQRSFDTTVSLRENYLSMDLVQLDENKKMPNSDINSDRFDRWIEVGKKFNEDGLIKQITERKNTDVKERWLIEVSFVN